MTILQRPMTLVVLTSYPWEGVLAHLRYRAPAERGGWRVLPGNEKKFLLTDRLAQADVVLIQRDLPRFLNVYQQSIAIARQMNKPIVYEIDDLLIGVPDEHPFQGEYVGVLNWMLAAIVEADQVIASTKMLQQQLLPFNVNTFCWPNYLVDEWWPLRPPRASNPDIPVIIGYMGSRTHETDLTLVEPALQRLLTEEGRRVQLRFWGCKPPEKLSEHPQVQWENIDIPEYPAFAAYFSQQVADIWIAPLQDTPFNRCKSAIKFLEYSALGAPGVYSRIVPYEEAVMDGQTGLLATSSDEWYDALVHLVSSPETRQCIATQAQQAVRERWLLSQHIAEWDKLYRDVRPVGKTEAQQQEKAVQVEIARQVQNHLYQRQQRIDDLTEQVRAAARYTRDLTSQIQDLNRQIQGLNGQVQGLSSQLAASQLRSLQLDEILQSRSWRLLQTLHRVRHWLIPVGSRRDTFFQFGLNRLGFRRGGRVPDQVVDTSVISGQYAAWIARNEPDQDELARQRLEALAYRPLISIVTPVYNTPAKVLRAMIESVQAQTYDRWELCVADGHSTELHVSEMLRRLSEQDARIRVVSLERNQGISGNSNVALSTAGGEFIAFLDHDDTLAPFALYEVARELNADSAVDVLYSDHDLLSADGSQRFSPLFKPGWSPEIMLSTNYITHLTVVRKTLIDQVGGFDPTFDGAQDWDLFLRVVERTERIVHIPKVLYHWRRSENSTAENIWAKPYAPRAQLKAIQQHLIRKGRQTPEVFFDPSGFIRVKWALRGTPKVSIIIPTNGVNRLLERCVASILEKTRYPNFEVLIVNNGLLKPGAYPYYTKITRDPRMRVVHYDRPFNYSAVNNFGAVRAQGDVLVFLNNDTAVLTPDWLDEIVMWTCCDDIGVVGAKLLKPDGTIQHAGVIIGLMGFAGHVFAGLRDGQTTPFGLSEWYRNVLAVTAACLGIRRQVFEKVGGFSEDFILCGNDVELCLRVQKAGYRVLYHPFVRLLHEESATRDGTIPIEDFRESFKCYQRYLRDGDPYFNPNLSHWSLTPALREAGELAPERFAEGLINDVKVS